MTSTSPNSTDRRTALDTLFDESDRIPLSPSEPGPSGWVLEQIEASSVLRDEPVSILCSGCGEVVSEHPSGLPSVVRHFREECSTHGELRRWSVVAVSSSHVDIVSTSDLERLTTGWWEQNMWSGIQTGENCPRTREFSELYDEQAERFDWEWRLRCPLCRRSLEEIGRRYLDFHHWRRDSDEGVCICRDCHDAIGRRERDMELDWRARKLGFMDQHDLQVARLAAREVVVAGAESLESLTQRLIDRFNVPFSKDETACLLMQALGDLETREQVLDDGVWQDLIDS